MQITHLGRLRLAGGLESSFSNSSVVASARKLIASPTEAAEKVAKWSVLANVSLDLSRDNFCGNAATKK